MDITRSKQLARDIFERGFGRGELDVVDAGLAPNAVDRHAFAPDEPDMRHHLKNAIGMLRGAIPDLQVTVADLFGEGDRIAVRVEMHGAHTGGPPCSASRRPVSRSSLSSSTSFSSASTASASGTGPTSASSSSC